MGQFEEQLLNLSHNRTLDYNQCQCLPKAELKTKTNPNGHHPVAVWVRFGFQLDSLEKSDPPNAENRVGESIFRDNAS